MGDRGPTPPVRGRCREATEGVGWRSYGHEVPVGRVPRRSFGDFPIVGKVTRCPQAAKLPPRENPLHLVLKEKPCYNTGDEIRNKEGRDCGTVPPCGHPGGPHHLPPGKKTGEKPEPPAGPDGRSGPLRPPAVPGGAGRHLRDREERLDRGPPPPTGGGPRPCCRSRTGERAPACWGRPSCGSTLWWPGAVYPCPRSSCGR